MRSTCTALPRRVSTSPHAAAAAAAALVRRALDGVGVGVTGGGGGVGGVGSVDSAEDDGNAALRKGAAAEREPRGRAAVAHVHGVLCEPVL